jgi:hypothetical protein
MTLICVTNSVDTVRSCVFYGEHTTGCSGEQRAWHPEKKRYIATGRECPGCLPRPAERGFLCSTCFEKLEATMSYADSHTPVVEAVDLITHLRSIESAPTSDDGIRGGRPGSRVIMPESWQQADELYKALAHVAISLADDWGLDEPEWDVTASVLDGFNPEAPIEAVWGVTAYLVDFLASDLDRLVSKQHGAAAAVSWVAAFQRSDRAFARELKPRKIPMVRCRNCHKQSLEWVPPLKLRDPRVIRCRNEWCQTPYDPQLIDFDIRVIREQLERPIGAGEYPLTARAMDAEGIEALDVPVVAMSEHGYQTIVRKGKFAGRYSTQIPWPTGSRVYATFKQELDALAHRARTATETAVADLTRRAS